MINVSTEKSKHNYMQQCFPEIDVVLLSWNRIEMTVDTINNLMKKKKVNLHIWVVDQGSEAENLNRLNSAVADHSNVHVKALGRNIGVPAGRNLGMKLGKAEYTVSIDNDAIFASEYALAEVAKIFGENSKIGIIGFRIMNYFTEQDDENSWSYPKSLKKLRDQRFTATAFCGCGHAIRRSAFQDAGYYDDNIFFMLEEHDLSYRVINLGYQIIYEPSVLVRHKVSPEARVQWKNRRFYYLVRNMLYINLKYTDNKIGLIMPILGYFLKGIYNKLPLQAVLGIIDSFRMYSAFLSQLPEDVRNIYRLTDEAKIYFQKNDLDYRGSLWHRVRNDVLAGLPGDSRSTKLSQ